MQRNRIAEHSDGGWLKEEIGHRVADRIFDVKRTFDTIVDLGCQRGYVTKHLSKVAIKNCLENLEKNKLIEFTFQGNGEKNLHARNG
jgi:NADH dehydrogenase [ubiquinone] 1 alpha subcomplex assembly factor 5